MPKEKYEILKEAIVMFEEMLVNAKSRFHPYIAPERSANDLRLNQYCNLLI